MITEKKPRIAISIGDFNGIGPEIILKALADLKLKSATPIIVAPAEVVKFAQSHLFLDLDLHIIDEISEVEKSAINVLNLPEKDIRFTPGILSTLSGKVAMQSIEKSIQLCMDGSVHGMVTAPISKEAVNLAGYSIPGHTEFLAAQTNTESVLMMLVSGNLRVALVTTHLPIKEVAASI